MSPLGKLAKEFHRLNIVAALVHSESVIKSVCCGKTSGTKQIKDGEQQAAMKKADRIELCKLKAEISVFILPVSSFSFRVSHLNLLTSLESVASDYGSNWKHRPGG